jgi:hypothetical protein
MENKDWLNDYKLLKQVKKDNPFTVPAGYFDDLGDRIVSRKNLDVLKSNNAAEGFTVPENYFEELEANIQSSVAIESVLSNEEGFTIPEGYFDNLAQQIQSRISVEKALGEPVEHFTVPGGYFDELAQQIQSRILIEEALGNPAEHFAVPEGYFDNLAQQIQSRILVEEAVGEPAEHFSVPAGYFNQLSNNILDKTVNAGNVGRKGVVRRMFATTAFKYATAACFAIAIGSGILLNEIANSPENAHKNSFLHKQLSAVPVDEIKNYLQLNVDAGDTQQTVTSEDAPVNDKDLKNALQNYVDSVQ